MNKKFIKENAFNLVIAILAGAILLKMERDGFKQDRYREKIDTAVHQTALNRDNISDALKEGLETKVYVNSLSVNIQRVDDKLDAVSKDYLTKTEFLNAFNKLENNTKQEQQRLGNVLYNDRLQQKTAIDKNTDAVRYLYGFLKLDGISPTYTNPVATVNLGKS